LESLFAVLFGYLLFRESVSWAKAGAIVLVVIGMALLNGEAR
jgi:drug/metabolite transporter (DMT)-like permease